MVPLSGTRYPFLLRLMWPVKIGKAILNWRIGEEKGDQIMQSASRTNVPRYGDETALLSHNV